MSDVAEVQEPYIASELSKSYADILGGTIPGEVDVFLILWQDRETDRFLSWGMYLSTSEAAPHVGKVDAFVALQCRMPVLKRTTQSLAESIARAMIKLENELFRTPKYVQLVTKLKSDLEHQRTLSVEALADVDYERITGRKVLPV